MERKLLVGNLGISYEKYQTSFAAISFNTFFSSPDTRLVGSGYYPATHCEADVADGSTSDLQLLADKNISSCTSDRMIKDEEELFLYGTFSFGVYNASEMLSVEVVIGGLMDCESIIWVWFVGSGDTRSPFRECSKYLLTQNKNSTSCLVTCSCVTPCVKLYFKYNLIQIGRQQRYNVCEIILRPGNIDPQVKYGQQIPWNIIHKKPRLYLSPNFQDRSSIQHRESVLGLIWWNRRYSVAKQN